MKNAVIWGAAGGIGQALVSRLVTKGWNIVAITHQPSHLNNLTSHQIDANVADPYEVQLAVTAASQIISEINLWIYAAGDITSVPVAKMSPDTWQRILDANLTGAYLTTHYSLPLLAPDAHLFYPGAISERLRLPGLAAYGTAKAGLEAFVQALAKEQRKHQITLVRPGAVDTALWDKVPMRLPGDALSAETVAEQILVAYEQKYKGRLDLMPA